MPPRALAAAYEALGAHRAAAPLDLLLAAAHTKRPLDIAQAGAIRALAATRRVDAVLSPLLSLSFPGVSSATCAAPVLALD